jgi:hypothetical protein
MVPEWLNKNDGPTISVKIMAGIPSPTPEELSDPKKMNSAYNRLSFGGSTRKFLFVHVAESKAANAHKLVNSHRYTFQCERKPVGIQIK